MGIRLKILMLMIVFLSLSPFVEAQKSPETLRKEAMSGCVQNIPKATCSCVFDFVEIYMTINEFVLVAIEAKGVNPVLTEIYLTAIDLCVNANDNRKFSKKIIDEFFEGCKGAVVVPMKDCQCIIKTIQKYLYTNEWVEHLFGKKTRKTSMVWDLAISQCKSK